MGSMGSGRHWYWGAKNSTDDYRSIDVRRWKRDGLLTPRQSFDWQWSCHGEVMASIRVRTEPDRVILTCRHRSCGEDWKGESHLVYLDWTDCNPGGQRSWFLCPARGCGRRVAILYGGGIFACRHCYQLSYPSQRKTGTTGWHGGQIESATSWAGSRAFSTATVANPRGCTGTPSSG